MADVALQFAIESLVPLINENWKLISGENKDCSHDLVDELNCLKAFLTDAAKYRKTNSEPWKHFVNQVQVVVYRAEGLIDKLLVQVQEKNTLEETAVRELAINIIAVLEQVKKIRQENSQAFQIMPILDDQQEIVAQRSQDALLEENEVVGFDEEAKKVIDRLAEGTNDLDVIPVVGLPGLGKTTLAVRIFNDPVISYEFFMTIWVDVGLEYKLKEVFLSILKAFTRHQAEYLDMGVNELSKIICEFISRGGKCLMVLDDVWTTDIVDSIMKVFPESRKGHRIMITTRDKRIGRYVNANPHLLKFLTDEESFQLLENRVFSSNSRCPEDLVAHGKSIAKQCSGVPLAVVVIAGALRGCTTKKEWKSIEDNVGQYLINEDEPESSLKFVEISYSHLPEDMKACFLYCGAFPRNYEIPAWKLIRLWISEGLINPKLRGSLEDIAEDYLNELVNRNLVMEMQKRADGQVKTCRLHDMFHQFCRMEAHNEGLLHEVCERAGQSEIDIPDLDTSRRVCIQPSLLEAFISKRPSAEHVRSFLCFSTEQKGSEQLSNIRLLHKAFPLARVLDAESLKFSFSRNFSDLFHLRYIAISSSHNTLPEFFGKFWHLQTLILNTKASTIEIKVDIWNMLRLRHLHTNVPALLQSPATQTTDEPSCLQTLSKVAPGSCREDVLARACNLRKVSVEGKMADFFETDKGEFSNFKKIKSLEKLKLLNDISSSMTKALQLPPAFFEFLGRLKKLTLSNTRFAWSDARKLGQLECLEVLKLKENAFVGTTWDSEGFRQLKVLWIQRADFRTWKASKVTFQRLKRLVLISCHKFEAVPSELAGVSSLQEMTLEYTKKANKSAKAIEGKMKEMQERMQKPAESKSGARTRALGISKFTLTIFPREGAEF